MSLFNQRLVKSLGLLAIAAVAYLIFEHYQAKLNSRHLEQVPQFTQAGQRFGASHDQQACLQETFRQSAGCSSFSCGVYYGKFFKACAQVAQASEQMCDGVPEFSQKKDQPSKDWIRDVCFERPEANTCQLLMRQVQWQCSQQ